MVRAFIKPRLLAVVIMLVCVACLNARPLRASSNRQGQIKTISDKTALWLLKQARIRVTGKRLTNAASQSVPREATRAERVTLFISTFTSSRRPTARTVMGRGESLVAALNAALDVLSSQRFSTDPDRIQIDVQTGDSLPLDKPLDSSPSSARANLTATQLIDIGAEGLVIETAAHTFYLLPSEIIYNSIAAEDADKQRADEFLDRAFSHTGLARSYWRSAEVKLSRFRAITVVEDYSRAKSLRILRGLVPVTEVSRTRLLDAARAGGDYLVRMQQPDGSFHYIFDPLNQRTGKRAYNIVRHAGTAFALLDLYATTREPRYLYAARRAIAFLKTRFRRAHEESALYVLDNDGKAKLGANGLALVALSRQIELDRASADLKSAVRLANLILAMQRKDGAFESYYPVRGDEPQGSVSLFYPGEAILGLISLYKLNGDHRLLEAAQRGARYLIESQRKAAVLPFDAWLMQALEALHSVNREPRFAEHAIAIAEAMIGQQYTERFGLELAGGFGPGLPRSTPAASRAEGLIAAYRIARSTGDARASKIADALKACARFQLSQQFDRDNSFYLPAAGRAAGGFRAGITSTQIRIDYVQHNISSLLAVARALY